MVGRARNICRARALIVLNNVKDAAMSLLTIFLPPVAVALKHGIGVQFLINIVLTLIGWLPGVIHAFWVNTRGGETLAQRR
jgi:uncharacterized membrane protein YqaE (UPF0057 family)